MFLCHLYNQGYFFLFLNSHIFRLYLVIKSLCIFKSWVVELWSCSLSGPPMVRQLRLQLVTRQSLKSRYPTKFLLKIQTDPFASPSHTQFYTLRTCRFFWPFSKSIWNCLLRLILKLHLWCSFLTNLSLVCSFLVMVVS